MLSDELVGGNDILTRHVARLDVDILRIGLNDLATAGRGKALVERKGELNCGLQGSTALESLTFSKGPSALWRTLK